MEKIAFHMQLKSGKLDEYRRAHDAIWPELAALLIDVGIRDYSIHHDPETDALFAVLWRTDDHRMASLADHPVMRRWWEMMAPLMETEADGAPQSRDLTTVFHLAPEFDRK